MTEMFHCMKTLTHCEIEITYFLLLSLASVVTEDIIHAKYMWASIKQVITNESSTSEK